MTRPDGRASASFDAMPRGLPPAELQELLRQPNPCVIASIRPDGELHTAGTWYEWTPQETVIVNMAADRLRLQYMRDNPRVALTVLAGENWHKHVSLIGRVKDIRRDPDLADIDRMSMNYVGVPYRVRERDSWTVEIEVSRWHGFSSGTDLTKTQS
jgi:PPOX class probable F420-dependent enzyme